MKAIFVSVGPPESRIVLTELPAMIGRDARSEIHSKDSWVANAQCIIDEDGGRLRVVDLGSKNGTFVNGSRVRKADLMPGDTLTVGRTDFRVHYEPGPRSGSSRVEHVVATLSP